MLKNCWRKRKRKLRRRHWRGSVETVLEAFGRRGVCVCVCVKINTLVLADFAWQTGKEMLFGFCQQRTDTAGK